MPSNPEPTELTAAERAVAEILWRELDGEDHDPEDGGHEAALLDHATLARELVAAATDAKAVLPESRGGIVMNVQPASNGSTVDNFAIGFSAGLQRGRRGY